MESLRQRYAKVIKRLEDRIDTAAAAWIVTEDPNMLWEYNHLSSK